MNRFLVALGVVSLLLGNAWAIDPPRDAEVILKDYLAIKLPVRDSSKLSEPDYDRSYRDAQKKAMQAQNALVMELFQSHPDHPKAMEMMITRWTTMSDRGIAEMDKFIKEHPDSTHLKEVMFTRARRAPFCTSLDSTKKLDYVNEFIRAYPQEQGKSGLLVNLAMLSTDDKEFQLRLYRRIAAEHAGTRAARIAEGNIRRVDGLGKPFELAFTEAMGGLPVSIKELRGKVVVVDFWSTRCGPCIADMPRLKELYAKYKEQGVEFIGVSLDEPGEGLTQMKAFVEKQGIPWPQYYQGNAWESEFSQSWGINMIPQLFIVDADGNLHSTEARAQLETLIPELIKRRDQKT